jgi:hypothetical protein
VARAQATREYVARLAEAGFQSVAARLIGVVGPCPLCGEWAIHVDWWPTADWIVVEGCACGGFFVAAHLVRARLPDLPAANREALAESVQKFRAMGEEAWCTTTDGRASGPLVIRTERPDRPR